MHGPKRVYVISCKAMQEGFSPNLWLAAAQKAARYKGNANAQKHLRELWDPTWARAHHAEVKKLTAEDDYTYVLAVTCMDRGEVADTTVWADDPRVSANLGGRAAEVWQLATMFEELTSDMTQRMEPSHVGRLAQMLRAAKVMD